MKLSQLILVSFFFTTSAFAGNVSNDADCSLIQDLTKDLKGIAKTICAQVATDYINRKVSQGQVVDACTNVKEVVWDPTRNNSMSSALKHQSGHVRKAGYASARINGQDGTVAATQVCPGVFITSAHGLLDDPLEGRVRSLKTRGLIIKHYTLPSDKKASIVENNDNIFSPRMKNKNNISATTKSIKDSWKDPSQDFAFVKVDRHKQTDHFRKQTAHFIPLAASGSTDLQNFISQNKISMHLYRPKSAHLMQNGWPVFGRSPKYGAGGRNAYHDSVQIVHKKCRSYAGHLETYSSTDCPQETGVSGAAYISKINGKQFYLGLAVRSNDTIENTNGGKLKKNFFINTGKKVCDYYEKACGQPCKKLNEIVR